MSSACSCSSVQNSNGPDAVQTTSRVPGQLADQTSLVHRAGIDQLRAVDQHSQPAQLVAIEGFQEILSAYEIPPLESGRAGFSRACGSAQLD